MAAISAQSVDPLGVTRVGEPSNSSSVASIFIHGDGHSSAPRTSFSGISRFGLGIAASPISPSNNLSGSSVTDSSSIAQQSPQQEQMPKQDSSSAMSQSMMRNNEMSPLKKRPRLSMSQEDVQRQYNNQLQSMIQMHRPSQVSPMRPPSESGLCARRLRQYMYHQRHRPDDNCISYWRKFVEEYFSPGARKRLCFSLYGDEGNHAVGSFPQAAMDPWRCGICGSKTGKGFEATYDVLPRLYQIKFDHGVIDELWYLDMASEVRLPSGMMVLDYAKAVQESVHEQLRVVREGHLRILFTPDLKILSWEFCAQRHEELLLRRKIVHQVNQLLHGAQKYQAAVKQSGSSGLSVQDLQASCNMFVAAGRQMARNVDLQSLNDLGFSKRYVRCLQISEIVNGMKDLIDFSWSHKMGPIESLKNYPQQAAANFQAQKIKILDQADAAQNLPTTLNKLAALHNGLGRHPSPATCFPSNFSHVADSTNNNLIRNIPNPRQNPLPPLHPSLTGFKQMQSVQLEGNGPSNVVGQSCDDMSIKKQQQQQQQQVLQGGLALSNSNEPPSSQVNHMIQRFPPEMKNKGDQQQSINAHNAKENVKKSEVGDDTGLSAAAKDAGEVQNGSGKNLGVEIKCVMPDVRDASDNTWKPVAINSNYCDNSSKSYDSKQDVFENLDLDDLSQDFSLQLVDMFQW